MQGRERPRIGGWLKSSFIDYPGTVSAVLFFRGCNLRCPWCHNPTLVLPDGDGPDVGFEEVVAHLERRREIIEGVVFTGGEPTLQCEALVACASRVRSLGFAIKLDTNGLIPEAINAVSPDYLAMDLKTVPHRYGELGFKRSGAECAAALEQSLDIVRSMGDKAEVRITMAAPFVKKEEMEAFATMLHGVQRVFLQPFKSNAPLLDAGFPSLEPLPAQTIREFRDFLGQTVPRCEIRGE